MKGLRVFVAIFSIFMVLSCGQGQKETTLQEKEKDSIMNLERDQALDNADKLLQRQDSIDAVNDTATGAK
ncbi:MAG TPA: hypothetical protein PKW80_06165 [Bacteroidales bacterium]|nr:hypothetical protein [Bacteroidales bacterium]